MSNLTPFTHAPTQVYAVSEEPSNQCLGGGAGRLQGHLEDPRIELKQAASGNIFLSLWTG